MTTKPDDRNGVSSPDNIPHDLVERLRRLPEVDPPEGLSARVMGALKPRRRPWWQTMRFRLSRPRSITFTPLKWAPLGAIAVILIIVFGLRQTPQGPVSSLHQEQTGLDAAAEAHYELGRRLLAEEQAQEALVHLKYATEARPDKALYHFWLGVNYWTLDDFVQERVHYQSALQYDPDFLPAHVYIGHNYLDRGDWRAALRHYRRVLQAVPEHAEALFNTGIATHRLGHVKQESAAWRAYLTHYDRGAAALQAVERLNANGDFTFRRIQLGPLNFVKPAINFDDGGTRLDAAAQASLDEIGRVVAHNRKLELHVLAYVANDAGAAELRAKTIKRYLLDRFAGIRPGRIKPSWFGVSEVVPGNDRTHELESSIRIFASMVDQS